MPKYGTCSECGGSVWLTEGGACPQGHGQECISGVAETASPQVTPVALPVVPQPPSESDKKSRSLVITAVVIIALLFCCLIGGILVAIAIPVFNAASETARESACFSQQRVMEGALQQWIAEEEGRSPSDLADYDALVGAIVPEYVGAEQVCPADGTYEYDPITGEVTCSLHGHYY